VDVGRAKATVNFLCCEVTAQVRRDCDTEVQDARAGAVKMRW
jgi:hypothetical protein